MINITLTKLPHLCIHYIWGLIQSLQVGLQRLINKDNYNYSSNQSFVVNGHFTSIFKSCQNFDELTNNLTACAMKHVAVHLLKPDLVSTSAKEKRGDECRHEVYSYLIQ